MDITTTYLNLTLRSPLVVGACATLTQDLGNLRHLEDAGAAAIVLHSLFEEQLRQDRFQFYEHLNRGCESFAEALTYFSDAHDFPVGPELYLKHIRKAKALVEIPIIASLNGSTLGGWTDYAAQIEQAGADALELNLYAVETDPAKSGHDVEEAYLDIVRQVVHRVNIPVAVKLSPYFSSIANFAQRISAAGANALVLFNRFYQPDIEIEQLEVEPHVLLSTPQDMRLPLRWIAILYGMVPLDFAASSGIQRAEDVIKMMMVGANATQVVSVLLRHGIDHLPQLEQGVIHWLETHEYESLQQLCGSMSQSKCPDPSAFERAQYMHALQTYSPAPLPLGGPS